jgi:Cdc6-like AAA superfamily ATPase
MIVDEMDYLISRNQDVLSDLFQLATYPDSCCILMGELYYKTKTRVCRVNVIKSTEKYPVLSIGFLVDLRFITDYSASCVQRRQYHSILLSFDVSSALVIFHPLDY